jgi:hypothetical protein
MYSVLVNLVCGRDSYASAFQVWAFWSLGCSCTALPAEFLHDARSERDYLGNKWDTCLPQIGCDGVQVARLLYAFPRKYTRIRSCAE